MARPNFDLVTEDSGDAYPWRGALNCHTVNNGITLIAVSPGGNFHHKFAHGPCSLLYTRAEEAAKSSGAGPSSNAPKCGRLYEEAAEHWAIAGLGADSEWPERAKAGAARHWKTLGRDAAR
jgi:hypothetical protein